MEPFYTKPIFYRLLHFSEEIMTSDKARTNKKWTSSDNYRENYDKIFKNKIFNKNDDKDSITQEGYLDNESKMLHYTENGRSITMYFKTKEDAENHQRKFNEVAYTISSVFEENGIFFFTATYWGS